MPHADRNLLVLNCGSSSIKFACISADTLQTLCHGQLEDRGPETTQYRYYPTTARTDEVSGHLTAHRIEDKLQHLFSFLKERQPALNLYAIGHRVVQGGERFHTPTRLEATTLSHLEGLTPLAPLHNPLNIAGIRQAMLAFPTLPQVAVFDTAFHHSLPPHAWRYAVPESWYRDQGVRRYGFHGISHAFVTQHAAHLLQKPLANCRFISLHLGNGASVAAIKDGHCIDTSMGMTPLEGLVMGTRSGDIDPAIVTHMMRSTQASAEAIVHDLNHNSGLLGLCGASDMRDILTRADNGDTAANLALAVYTHRIRKYIGAYLAETGPLDALIFTGGIGENASQIRERICAHLDHLGILCDPDRNRHPYAHHLRIDHATSKTAILVIRTQEETEIARQTATCLGLG